MSQPNETEFSFHEEQSFRQPWLWAILLMATLPVAALFVYAMIKQLVFGEPWGDRPLSDTALAILGTAMIVDCPLALWFFHSLRLVTKVRADGVHFQFRPFKQKHIRFDEIETCEARKYDPLCEYGGWGIRWWPGSGKAYNVGGNQGVQLVLTSGKRLLIGSQRADDLAHAIQAGMA